MEAIASIITDPTKLITLPILIARTAFEFAMTIMQQSFLFVEGLFTLMV